MARPEAKAYLLILAPGTLIKTSIESNNIQKLHRSSRGFTLLELMVVIVIVGIMFSFLALSIRSSSPEEAIKKESQRLHHLIQLALEEAVLRGEEYAVLFKPNSYQFVHLTDHGWQPIENDRLLRLRELPLDIAIELEVEKKPISHSIPKRKKTRSNLRYF